MVENKKSSAIRQYLMSCSSKNLCILVATQFTIVTVYIVVSLYVVYIKEQVLEHKRKTNKP